MNVGMVRFTKILLIAGVIYPMLASVLEAQVGLPDTLGGFRRVALQTLIFTIIASWHFTFRPKSYSFWKFFLRGAFVSFVMGWLLFFDHGDFSVFTMYGIALIFPIAVLVTTTGPFLGKVIDRFPSISFVISLVLFSFWGGYAYITEERDLRISSIITNFYSYQCQDNDTEKSCRFSQSFDRSLPNNLEKGKQWCNQVELFARLTLVNVVNKERYQKIAHQYVPECQYLNVRYNTPNVSTIFRDAFLQNPYRNLPEKPLMHIRNRSFFDTHLYSGEEELSRIEMPAHLLPTTNVQYSNPAKGISIRLPYNQEWGTKQNAVAPFDEFEDVVVFGPLHICSQEGLCRTETLKVIPRRTSELVKEKVGIIRSLPRSEAYEKFGSELRQLENIYNLRIKTINGKTVMEYEDRPSAGGYRPHPRLEIVGKSFNYLLSIEDGYLPNSLEKDFDYLESIASTIEVL